MKEWYLLRCKPRNDRRVLDNLLDQEYVCYSPWISVNKLKKGPSRSSSSKIPKEPLFPGYIFVQMGGDDSWSSVRFTRGVLDFVRFDRYPVVVSGHIVDEIMNRIEDIDGECYHINEFSEGEKVRVTQGCFDGIEGVYKCKSGCDRSIVLLNIVKKCTEVKVDNINLQSAY